MVDAGLNRCVHRAQQIVIGLSRSAVDQIEADVFKTLGHRLTGRERRPPRRVHPVEGRQHVRRHRLHAQRYPRVSGRPDRPEEFRPGRLGVGLGADLGIGRQRKIILHHTEQRAQALPTK